MNEEKDLEKEMEKIVATILIPIVDELKSRAKEVKQKRLELRKEIYNINQLKQSLIEKRKKLNKQKLIYEKHMNSDFSNAKTCEECLKNYINIMDKKQNDFLKEKDDYYELKLRKKQLEFNNLLIDLIKEKTNIAKKKKITRTMSFDAPRRINQSNRSLPKNNLNKSFKSEAAENTKNKTNNKKLNKNKTATPKRVLNSQINNKNNSKSKNSINSKNKESKPKDTVKDTKVNKNIKRKKSNENKSIENKNNENNVSKKKEKIEDISGEIENLINNYSSKKNGKKSSNQNNSENYSEGLEKLKEINKETKNFEDDLKEIMNDFLDEEKES